MQPTGNRVFMPRWVLILATVAGLVLFVRVPIIQQRFGLFDSGRWFIDSYAILAASDAVQKGMNPWVPNPLDYFSRPHSYSSWWFVLGKMGLSRADNFWFGGLCVTGFLAVAFSLLRPRSLREALIGVVTLLAPPFLLAINRANNDLVVVALLGAGLLAYRWLPRWREAGFVLGVVLATGLKFYPVVAIGGALALRPWRKMLVTVLAGGVLAGTVLYLLRSDLQRATVPDPAGVYVYGAPLWLIDMGLQQRGWAIALGLIILTMSGVILAMKKITTGLLSDSVDEGDALVFATGAILMLATFCAGISYTYRWVLALLLVPWLMRGRSPIMRIGLALVIAAIWIDGLFCAFTNVFIGPMPEARLELWQHYWRLCTQPVTWGLMALLSGWLWDALLTHAKSLRASRAFSA